MDIMTLDLMATFHRLPDGWMLSEMDFTPAAGPHELAAVVGVLVQLIEQDGPWPIVGSFWSGVGSGNGS